MKKRIIAGVMVMAMVGCGKGATEGNGAEQTGQAKTEQQALPKETNDTSYISFICLHKT